MKASERTTLTLTLLLRMKHKLFQNKNILVLDIRYLQNYYLYTRVGVYLSIRY